MNIDNGKCTSITSILGWYACETCSIGSKPANQLSLHVWFAARSLLLHLGDCICCSSIACEAIGGGLESGKEVLTYAACNEADTVLMTTSRC